MSKSRKMFTFEYMEGNARTRVLVPDTETKYDPTKHFMWFEESDYLGEALNGVPYATFKTDDPSEMSNLLQNGYLDKDDVIWTPFFAYWKDQEGHAFLCPETAGIKDLRDVGVFTSMNSPADFMKVGKYANRLFAALPKSLTASDSYGSVEGIWGKEVAWNEADQIAIVRVDVASTDLSEEDRELAVRYVDLKTLDKEQKAVVDGSMVFSEKACRALGLSKQPRLGMAWRGTIGTERGLGKGHILYKNDMAIDIVIYGPKTILKTSKFFFGSMGELHVGIPHTDRQAYVNFHYHRPGLGVNLARAYMRRVLEASQNEQELRRMFLRHTASMTHADMDQEGWILRRALMFGVSFLRFPGLFRRVVRYLMLKVMQCDQRARIPMDTVAAYAYVLPDINVIGPDGDVIMDNSGIPDGHLVFPDIKPGTRVVTYRQPSENTNAWVPLTITYRPEYKRFANRGICLLGRGADKVLGRLGGGDMDDQFVIVHDPRWVEAFHTMRPYPETEKLSAEVTEQEQEAFDQEQTMLNQFTEELLADIQDHNLDHYTNKHVSWQMDMAKNARAGIGPVVNFGIFDMLQSDPDQMQSMLADLSDKPEYYSWLADREPWQAALFMTNLEIVIDGNVKDTTLLRKLGDISGTIKAFHNNCMVYPASMARHIPERKQEEGGYVLARSLTCRSFDQIRYMRNILLERLTDLEWSLVTPADKDLRGWYPREKEIAKIVGGEWTKVEGKWVASSEPSSYIRGVWATEWQAEMAQPGGHEKAYERICNVILNRLRNADENMMERLAVELYYQIYRSFGTQPQVDSTTGALRGYPDGLLWSPVFGNHFINALRKSRLSGFYKAAEIYPEFRNRIAGKYTWVQVRNHMVYIQDSQDEYSQPIGFLIGVAPDGKFLMYSGLIEFRKPQPICLPDKPELIAQGKPVRVIPSAGKPAQPEQPAEQPKGVFSKMLNAAKDLLSGKSEDKK